MAFVKDMLRMWAHSWKRFISIAMITLLGVAVLTGIYAGCRDAFRGTDRFFDAQGLHDIQVLSTAGLTDGDIAALRAVDGVAKVQAERSQEVTFDLDGGKSATMQEIGTDGIDQPYVQEGHLPRKAGEIAVTRKFMLDSGKKIGSHLTVAPEATEPSSSDTQVSDSAESDKQTGKTVARMSDSPESDKRGAQSDACVSVSPESDIHEAKNGVQMSDSPESDTQSGAETIAVADETGGASEADAAPSFPTRLTIVGVVLDPRNLSNPDGYSAMTSFRSTATTDYTFFAPSDGVAGTLYTSATLLVTGAADENTFGESYENTVKQVTDRINDTVKSDRQKARRQELLDAGNKQIADARAEADKKFAEAQSQIDENRRQFDQQVNQIVSMQTGAASEAGATGSAGTTQLDDAMRETMRETAIAASPELTQAKQQLDQAQSQLDEQKAQTEQTLKTKEKELKTSIPQVRWYVQDRQSLGGFSALKSDLDSIQSLGNAFPVVFLVVAVMMSLTSMARMVEEDRSLIGTYVGLGYGRLAVASRYLLFALLACLIGGGLGLLAGFLGIPAFLLVVLQGMYVMPGVRLEYDWLYGSLGIALFVVGVLAATIYACVQEMRMTPAALMRPKAPRAGSRILLERIKPVWNRMGFLSKVTARNIFRFKSRLIMTVGGVAGCTALIVCGLAINDTVADLGIKQYRDIYQYDLMVVSADSDADVMHTKVESDGRVTSSLDLRIESGDLAISGGGDGNSGNSGSESIQLVAVPEKRLSDLGNMVTLQPVHSGILGTSSVGKKGSLKLEDDGVIVAQSAASVLGITAGSKVRLTNGDGVRATAKVSAVNRNLIGSDVYISETYYAKLFGKSSPSASNVSVSGESDTQTTEIASHVSVSGESDKQTGKTGGQLSVSAESDAQSTKSLTWNAMYAKLSGSDQSQTDYAESLEKDSSVMKAVSSAHMADSFKFDLMGAVVSLIVALAGGLALVVLFTLANTNVSERVREMATLKVLGFFDREVHHYVNREMMILAVMGVVLGLPLGRFVGGLLTMALNMPSLYFEVEVKPLSYVIAAAATMTFALLVQLFVNPVLDRIDPISSLKSVE
ncbi:ABC transporter permease [Bifidobacterium ruminantium]|uniref:FtsX-like permease family protein n=1 Tax=Bifidobacterium ruminantium TaxID=78346 RepID=UPI00195DD6FB|nr:FtsX-like permease family protein [Bifidobacterium ruminantium]MBM6747108.1 ABC transporter permease [Bifidobacterium ruminantium]